jgi:hypothetical protein
MPAAWNTLPATPVTGVRKQKRLPSCSRVRAPSAFARALRPPRRRLLLRAGGRPLILLAPGKWSFRRCRYYWMTRHAPPPFSHRQAIQLFNQAGLACESSVS